MAQSLNAGVTMDWLMEDAIAPGAGLSLARMCVDAGVTSAAHRHPDCNEVVHLLSGEVEQHCGTDWLAMRPGETLLIPAGSVHQTRNKGNETAVQIIAYSSGARVYETVTEQA